MLKPVTLLALDEVAASLADAVQRRVATTCGLVDLVQSRFVGDGDLAEVVSSVHARRQAPESPLRARDDISTRELVLLIASSDSGVRTIDAARRVRKLYDIRRLAEHFTIELLVLLPELLPSGDYGAAYSLLKLLSAHNPCDAVWLVDSVNAHRVRFGTVTNAAYPDVIAGAVTLEPELSGALSGAFRPRGQNATFSSCGYAELVFPRDAAVQRVESRLAAQMIREKLLNSGPAAHPRLAAKQFVIGETFAAPLERLGVDAGQSLFRRFQAKTFVSDKTRNAEELIAAVRAESKVHRETTHMANLQALAAQGEQTAAAFVALLTRTVDETLDRQDYTAAMGLLEALLDPLPDLRADADLAPRNLVTEINTASAALDARLGITPNTAASDGARRRVRELEGLLQDQKLAADVLSPVTAADQLAEMERERDELLRRLPELLFGEESENSAARNAARDAEAARLLAETETREQQLRDLFAQRPRAEQVLREALEERREFIQRQVTWGIVGVAAAYATDIFVDWLRISPAAAAIGVAVFAAYSMFRYFTNIARRLRTARETLERLRGHIDAADKSKNSAHNDELQYEYDVAHRRTMLSVLRRTREAAKNTFDALRVRVRELEELAASYVPASITSHGVTIAVMDDADVDGWFERMAEDRKPLLREFPISRSQSHHRPLNELRDRVAAYAAGGAEPLRKLTITQAAVLVPGDKLSQCLKRFLDYTAPLIEVRGEDVPAQRAMQRDTTLWIDTSETTLVSLLQRRVPEAHLKPPPDPLRVQAVTRVLHYPAYVLGQIEYYRAQYDPAKHPESAALPDLLPTELVLAGPLREAYEQVLLGRAAGIIRIRDDGKLAVSEAILGDSHLAAAERLVAIDSAPLRHELEGALAPRLSVACEIERDLRGLLETEVTPLDRDVIDDLLQRYGTALQ